MSDDERLVDALEQAVETYTLTTGVGLRPAADDLDAARAALLAALRERAERVEELERENDVLRSSLLSS